MDAEHDEPHDGDEENAAPAGTPRSQLQANRVECDSMELELGTQHERRASLQVQRCLQNSSELKWLQEVLADRARNLSRRLKLLEKMLAAVDQLHAAMARGTEMLSKRRADAGHGAAADFGEVRLRANDALRRFKHIADSVDEYDQRKRGQVAEERRHCHAQAADVESSLAHKMNGLGELYGAPFDVNAAIALCKDDKTQGDKGAEGTKSHSKKLQASVAEVESSYRRGIAAERDTLDSAARDDAGPRLYKQVAERDDELLLHEEAGGARAHEAKLRVDKLTEEVNAATVDSKGLADKLAGARRKVGALKLDDEK